MKYQMSATEYQSLKIGIDNKELSVGLYVTISFFNYGMEL